MVSEFFGARERSFERSYLEGDINPIVSDYQKRFALLPVSERSHLVVRHSLFEHKVAFQDVRKRKDLSAPAIWDALVRPALEYEDRAPWVMHDVGGNEPRIVQRRRGCH